MRNYLNEAVSIQLRKAGRKDLNQMLKNAGYDKINMDGWKYLGPFGNRNEHRFAVVVEDQDEPGTWLIGDMTVYLGKSGMLEAGWQGNPISMGFTKMTAALAAMKKL